jgi:hypothetical protein
MRQVSAANLEAIRHEIRALSNGTPARLDAVERRIDALEPRVTKLETAKRQRRR